MWKADKCVEFRKSQGFMVVFWVVLIIQTDFLLVVIWNPYINYNTSIEIIGNDSDVLKILFLILKPLVR